MGACAGVQKERPHSQPSHRIENDGDNKGSSDKDRPASQKKAEENKGKIQVEVPEADYNKDNPQIPKVDRKKDNQAEQLDKQDEKKIEKKQVPKAEKPEEVEIDKRENEIQMIKVSDNVFKSKQPKEPMKEEQVQSDHHKRQNQKEKEKRKESGGDNLKGQDKAGEEMKEEKPQSENNGQSNSGNTTNTPTFWPTDLGENEGFVISRSTYNQLIGINHPEQPQDRLVDHQNTDRPKRSMNVRVGDHLPPPYDQQGQRKNELVKNNKESEYKDSSIFHDSVNEEINGNYCVPPSEGNPSNYSQRNQLLHVVGLGLKQTPKDKSKNYFSEIEKPSTLISGIYPVNHEPEPDSAIVNLDFQVFNHQYNLAPTDQLKKSLGPVNEEGNFGVSFIGGNLGMSVLRQ